MDEQPNGLPISRAALIDCDAIVADSDTQNHRDLARRLRRRLHGPVGRHGVLIHYGAAILYFTSVLPREIIKVY